MGCGFPIFNRYVQRMKTDKNKIKALVFITCTQRKEQIGFYRTPSIQREALLRKCSVMQ